MTNRKALLPLFIAASICLGGCSLFHHHQPKSSFKIIPEGERNPYITETPDTVRDTSTQKVEVETGPVGSQ